MIEDDLRDLLASVQSQSISVYARLIPMEVPECLSVQHIGGSSSSCSIRKAVHRVSVLAVSKDRSRAASLMRNARDTLITHLPADINGTHYYYARALMDGTVRERRLNDSWVEFCDLEVVASV